MRRLLPALLLATLATRVPAAPPPTFPWQDAGAHVGTIVTVEGDVLAAHAAEDSVVLDFAPDDPRGFRVILLVPLLSDLPRHPEQLYAGKRIRASGRIERFQGRPEMVLHVPDQIEVIDVARSAPVPLAPPAGAPAVTPPAAPPPPPPTPPVAPARATPRETPAVAPPAPVAAPPPPAPAAVPPPAPAVASSPTPTIPPEPPPARGLAEAVQRQLAPPDRCEEARGRWRDARAAVAVRAAALARCLDATTYDCRPEGAALAPGLSTLEGAAQQVEAACP